MKPTSRNFALAVGAAAASAIVAIGVPLAIAAPTAAPPSDGQGYINSTARCTAPDSAVLFGTTGTSRVAICKTPAGAFEYRGVRVSDGAKLIVTATQSTTDTFVAKNDGVTYMVTPTALSVTIGGNTLRTESWVDFHGAPAPAASGTTSSKPSTSSSATTSAATPTTSGTATPSTAATAAPSSTPGLSTPGLSTPAATTAPSSAVPLPPPLPAEAGGSTSSGR
ncbi:MAG TPA: hypothetical protein PLH92_05265 [Mycobacterium sp.]|uniref:hypothetical protein n=1 Tax=Mycolicibacterium sp. TaxID=2320850 RepID=UPI00260101CD|nr:hypothetical protein [Mycolicibacterium sp.]HPX35880.1 hypothetical protein [Mycobacterium sp.]HQC76112.1 hypothetical protein [Mycobacterium sp.]